MEEIILNIKKQIREIKKPMQVGDPPKIANVLLTVEEAEAILREIDR